MEAFKGPISTTSLPVGAINLPSEVPPAVDWSTSLIPVTAVMDSITESIRVLDVVRKGEPLSSQSAVKSKL